MIEDAATRLHRALAHWDAAEAHLSRAAAKFVAACDEQRAGPGAHRGMQALKEHLAWDRYRLPAALFRAIIRLPPAETNGTPDPPAPR